MKELIKKLCSSPCVSGCEITDEDNGILELLKQHNIPYEIDSIGNVVFQKKGNGEKTLMLVAHYDEIGFAVKYIDEDGFVYFSAVGGIDISILRGQRVVIMHDGHAVDGVIGVKPIHMINHERNKNNNLDVSDMWIDVGLAENEEINKLVSVGDYISFPANFTELNGELFTSKSIDNRVGVATLLSLYEKIKCEDVAFKTIYFVLSSQEELGMRGAKVAGYSINPDWCIAIDVTHATDYPTVNKHRFGDIKLNQGAVIPAGSNFSPSLQYKLKRIAIEKDIPFQIESLPCYSGTDIAEVQISRNGCKSGLVSIPCRYMHTPIEIASYKDIHSAVCILANFCITI